MGEFKCNHKEHKGLTEDSEKYNIKPNCVMARRLRIISIFIYNLIVIENVFAQPESLSQDSLINTPLLHSIWDTELNNLSPSFPPGQFEEDFLFKMTGKVKKSISSGVNTILNKNSRLENDSLSFHTHQVTDTLSTFHSLDHRSFKAGSMNIEINNPSLNKFIPDKKISLPAGNIGSVRKKVAAVKNSMPLPGPSVPIDSISLKKQLGKYQNTHAIDEAADRQFIQTRQGNELQKMATTTGQVKTAESEIDKINIREIKESAKNGRIMKKAIHESILNNPSASTNMKEKFQSARNRMEKLKKKYSCLPSSLDPSRGTKRNSLKGTPFRQRFILGGSLSMSTLKPFSLDLSPSLTYKIKRNIRAGLTGQYRLNGPDPALVNRNIPSKLYSFGVFGEYLIGKGIFAHLEFNRQVSRFNLADNKIQTRRSNGLLIGIGKEYRITKGINGTCLLLYDTLHKRNGPYSRPWQVRLGVDIQ